MEYEIIKNKNSTIYLLGTAHISNRSKETVRKLATDLSPDIIAIELDDDRYQKLVDPLSYQNLDIARIIKESKVYLLIVNLILSSYQKRLAKNLKSVSGVEMLEAINITKEKNIKLALIDRNINLTFQRLSASLSFIDKLKLINLLISALFDKQSISEKDLEELKSEDLLTKAINELALKFPKIKKYIVDERDMYLASKLKNLKEEKILAIVGAAHVNGIKKYFNEDINLNELELKPKKGLFKKLKKYLFSLFIILLFAYLYFMNKDLAFNQIKDWILINGSLAALAAIITLCHPLTIIAAFLLAPITTVDPILSIGMICALMEAYFKKPLVADIENISEDYKKIKTIYKNRFLRILLVFVLCNLFASAGSIYNIINNLFKLF